MFKKMLVPLDGSKLAEEVFPYAKALASRLRLELHFLNVSLLEESATLPMRQTYVEKMAEIVSSQINEYPKRTESQNENTPVMAFGKAVIGYPPDEILKYADANEIDIILIATHGHSGIKRWMLGSVAHKIIHASKVPVWLVRSGVPNDIIFDQQAQRTILVPLDGSKMAESVLPYAEALVKQRGPVPIEIVLLSVCEPDLLPEISYYIQTEYPPSRPLKHEEYVKQETEKTIQACRSYLAQMAAKLAQKEIKVRTEVLTGNPSEELIKYANKNQLQLIVMASHGRSGFSHLTIGSVAEKVLYGVNVPVFLITPQNK
jgi:nucleotide-binding universal stress UspA family protein